MFGVYKTYEEFVAAAEEAAKRVPVPVWGAHLHRVQKVWKSARKLPFRAPLTPVSVDNAGKDTPIFMQARDGQAQGRATPTPFTCKNYNRVHTLRCMRALWQNSECSHCAVPS